MRSIDIYTDGGCHGNPGPGAWAYVVASPPDEASGAEGQTTNNRMELTAVIEALRHADQYRGSAVRIHTDSQYVKNGITTWIKTWIRNGWRTASKKPVKNRDLWEILHWLDQQVEPQWHWVKGHAGIDLNERCDQLVQQAISRITP